MIYLMKEEQFQWLDHLIPNSANSQFFICFEPAPYLDRNYTVFGKVIEGMEFVDKIKKRRWSKRICIRSR